MLETLLVGHVLAGRSRSEPIAAAGGATVEIDVDQALRLLAGRETRRLGTRSRNGVLKRVTATETNDAILRKLRSVQLRSVRRALLERLETAQQRRQPGADRLGAALDPAVAGA